jgi:phosphomannomutase
MSNKRVLVLFDVDGTLTVPRGDATTEVTDFLQTLRSKVTVGIVGGSDLVKQEEQMGKNITNEVDYSFSENGLVAYKDGKLIGREVTYCVTYINKSDHILKAIHTYLGEENIKALVNFSLHYIADLDLPVKRSLYNVVLFSRFHCCILQWNFYRVQKWYDKHFTNWT